MSVKSGILQSTDSGELSSGIINCSGSNDSKMKRRKKLRKMGFDPEELSKQNTIRMNKENFQRIAEQQLKNTQIFLPNDIPRLERMKSFKDKLKLSQKIYSAMAHYEIEEPTPIQQIAIPYITDSDCDNMVIQAQTGSGKTHAFILPIIDYVIQAKSNDRHYTANATSPHAIIVAPTKELTVQLACDATRLIPDMNWHVGISFSFGGQDPRDANKMLNAGCDILILTPGRLFDYFGEHDRSNSRLNTRNLKFLVLDEADILLKPNNRRKKSDELKSSNEILYDFIVRRLRIDERRNFRCILLSATIDMRLFREYIIPEHLITIKVGGSYATFTVKQSFVEIKHETHKQEDLMEIIDSIAEHYQNESGDLKRKIGKMIIFVNEKRMSDRLAHALIAKGFSCMSLNADRSTTQRLEALRDLMCDKLDILVCTDVVSRGINIPRVDYIINYDLPNELNSTEYIHRIGRCGRIGNIGHSITMFNPNTDSHLSNTLIEGCRAAGQEVPQILIESAYNYSSFQTHRKQHARNSNY